ncbi:hypothetical protein FACS1894102_2660 [Spirochaetia bacterium]|nr:hypothetical protein FACS1894102_2660 [Spirochaetia bacterium]
MKCKSDSENPIVSVLNPLTTTSSPAFFNAVFDRTKRNAVYIRFPSDNIDSFINLADEIGIEGASVTIPHKEKLLHHLSLASEKVTLYTV